MTRSSKGPIARLKRMVPEEYKKVYWRVRHLGFRNAFAGKKPRQKIKPSLAPVSFSAGEFSARNDPSSVTRSIGPSATRSAIIVSFYGGKQYYADAASRLAENCDRLGLQHDIRKIEIDPKADWADICRKKVQFYREMLKHHNRPVMWVDVDSIIVNYPEAIVESTADITCFLRNFKYLPHFDPAQFSRLFAPPFLRFDYNPRVMEFLDFACALEQSSDVKATDDYFFQEAIKTWGADLRFMLLSPSDICTENNRSDRPNAYFMNGNSGNVNTFKGGVEQHQIEALSIDRQRRVLMDGAADAAKQGRSSDALVFYNRILALDPNDAEMFTKISDIYRRQENWDSLKQLRARNINNPALESAISLSDFLLALDQAEMAKAEEIMQREKAASGRNYPLMKSRHFRFSLDARARQMDVKDDLRVPLWWMENPYPGNFGDIINPYIVEKLTGVPPKFSTTHDRVLAIGSIIKFAKAGTKVWGAGCPDSSQALNADAEYCAVRGPITEQLVKKAGGTTSGVYGDPAWLLPLIYKPTVNKRYKLGLILHQAHMDTALSVDDNVKIIDINRVGYDEIEAFIDDMHECEALLTTSLHGIIAAHAYGIPVRHCVFSTAEKQIRGDGTKFEDYFRSVGSTRPAQLDLSDIDRVHVGLAEQCTDNPVTAIDVLALLQAAPFEVKTEFLDLAANWTWRKPSA